jgi:hypothetical protein
MVCHLLRGTLQLMQQLIQRIERVRLPYVNISTSKHVFETFVVKGTAVSKEHCHF